MAEVEATNKDGHPSDHAAYRAHKLALEMYALLLYWFVSVSERGSTTLNNDGEAPIVNAASTKGRGRGGKKATGRKDDWTWDDSILETLGAMAKALRLRSERIWSASQERDAFIS